ncbi:hypothetical protein DMUE_5716 [Dictyocoela muelleri]|nr:hypothetical protein DMUE_5716 [Dictyocoela muelleri]
MIDHNSLIIISTKRNKEKLLYKGYSYHLRQQIGDKKYWRCTNRKCSSSIITTITNIIISENFHKNHYPDLNKNEVLYVSEYLKKRALTTRELSRDIIDQSLSKISRESMHFLPQYKSLRNRISVLRRSNTGIQPNANDDVPDVIRKTQLGEFFYLYDTGQNDENRVIVFSTASNILHLENSPIWICDGTFRSCPTDFFQIYTIMGIINNRSFPLLYFLMKKKSVDAYLKGFTFLSKKIKKHPELVIIDFEMASLIALKQIFNFSRIEGCFFHLTQLIIRRIQKNQLFLFYKQNFSFRFLIKIIFCLAFIPIDDLEKTADDLDIFFKENIYCSEVELIWSWFKQQYIKNYQNNKDDNVTIFNPVFWSIYKRTLEMEPLTTNALESWHRSLNQYIRVPHPSLKEIGLELLKEQQKIELNLTKSFYDPVLNQDLGENNKNKMIRDIVKKYGEFDNIHYLNLLARLIN